MNFKLSNYIVISDSLYDEKDNFSFKILFSTRTTEIFKLNMPTIELLELGLVDDLPLDIFEELIKAEILIPESENELATIINRNNAAIEDDKVLYYVIQPSAQCQLGCGYCGQKHENFALHDDVIEKIAARIDTLLSTKKYRQLYIAWFGGEPLLAMTKVTALTNRLKTIAQQHNCTYGAKIVTNGVALSFDRYLTLVNDCNIDQIEITLDGPKSHHDIRRHTKNGSPSFDNIINNLINICHSDEFEKKPAKISIRCNVDNRNKDSVPELINYLKDLSLQNKLTFYIAPIHSWGNDAHKISLTHDEFGDLEIDTLMDLDDKGFKIGILPSAKPVVCLSLMKDAEVIDAYGNIFNCTEVPYVPVYDNTHYKLGDLKTDETLKPRVFSDFNENILAHKLPCSTCNMLPVCGGACPKQWEEGNVPCPPSKHNIKQKLLLYYLNLSRQTKTLQYELS